MHSDYPNSAKLALHLIFRPYPVQGMAYLKATQKNQPNGHFTVREHQSKNVSNKI